MRLRVTDPALVPELIEFLESRADMVTQRVGENEVEVSVLGSYGPEGGRMTLDLLVRAWEAGRAAGSVSVELID
jgi:hypothetical protein